MPDPTGNLYDALGVPRNAKLTDIGRAYNKLKSDFRKETTAPDPRREALIEEAWQVLSDEARRDEYDASLRAKPAKPVPKAALAGSAVAIVVGVGTALYVSLRPDAPAQKPGRVMQDIQADAARSVGRVHSQDMSGGTKPLGLAFAIEEGVMATACHGLVPGETLTVTIAPRSIPARLTAADENLGLCKLAVDGGASWPLAVAGAEPRPGDKVYSASLNAAGEVVLAEGAVKQVRADAQGKVIDMSAAAGGSGAPVLDIHGRVIAVAVASGADGAVRLIPMPATFVATRAERPSPPPSAPAEPVAAPATSATPAHGTPAEVDEAKYREELGKALKGTGKEKWGEKIRPPPNVPKDL